MPIRPENKARYPHDWKLRSRFVRFVRARGLCEWCGVRHGAWGFRPPFGDSTFIECGSKEEVLAMGERPVRIILTTAHVFDDRPEASGLLNLAALCQKCHNGHDAKARRRRIGERREAASKQARLCE